MRSLSSEQQLPPASKGQLWGLPFFCLLWYSLRKTRVGLHGRIAVEPGKMAGGLEPLAVQDAIVTETPDVCRHKDWSCCCPSSFSLAYRLRHGDLMPFLSG